MKKAIHSKLGLLGLSIMVFGLMAFSATGAPAEVGAKWLLGEKPSGSGSIPFLDSTVGLQAETTGVLHTEIAKVKVLFECTTTAAENLTLIGNGSIAEKAIIKFTGCITKLNGVTSAPCQPKGLGVAGLIETEPLHGLLILFKLTSGVIDHLLKILPDEGKVLALIEMGDECAIGTKVNILGKATIKDCENLSLTRQVKHLVEVGTKAELTEVWAISETVEHEATILGSAWAFLTGKHEELKFSGEPA